MNPIPEQSAELPAGVTRDRYCSPKVTLEACYALLIELEPADAARTHYMYWRGDKETPGMKSQTKAGLRELRPGESVFVEGKKRTVKVVQVYR